MHINTQIDRGLEKVLATNEAARLSGMYGLAGFENVETFNGLEGFMQDNGVPGAADQCKLIRRRHGVLAQRMKDAVPVAKRAMELMDENNGDLSGIFSKVGKALKKGVKSVAKVAGKAAKKIAKVAVKSPIHKLIAKTPLKKISATHKIAEGKSALTEAMIGPAPVKDPTVKAEMARIKAEKKAAKAAAAAQKKADKAAAKQAKKDAKAAAALARAGVKSGTPTVEAGAQVLANQTGVNLATPAAQDFAQQVASNIAQPGSTLPTASMFSPQAATGSEAPAAAEGGTGPFGLPMPVVIGAGVLLGGGLLYAVSRKKRG